MFLPGETAPGGAALTEYDIDIAGVGAGTHSLQILRADHGGATGHAISVDATPAANPASSPATRALPGLGLIARHPPPGHN